MPHHKRRRPKFRRAGCLMCKPWKDNANKDSAAYVCPRDRRAIAAVEPVEGCTPPAKPKRKRGKKVWTIEYRTSPKALRAYQEKRLKWWPFGPGTKWVTYSNKYATEAARDDALRRLRIKAAAGEMTSQDCEFRPGNP